MIPGLQTHIEGWTDPAELAQLPAMGYRLARISAMEMPDEKLLECVRDVEAVGLTPFITIADPARIRLLPGRDFECRNEDDGDLAPRTYRQILDEMAAIALETGSRLWGPTCSNTNRKCVRWARAVRGSGWPDGLHGISWHSYDPHENTLFADVRYLAEGRPICWSEFGYPNLGEVTEDQQAAQIAQLWRFYQYQPYYAAILFQIHDGPSPTEREHRYGIRRFEGDWKPCAFVIPDELRVTE